MITEKRKAQINKQIKKGLIASINKAIKKLNKIKVKIEKYPDPDVYDEIEFCLQRAHDAISEI